MPHVDDLDDIEAENIRLINELLTRAGMLMEDASTLALLSDSCEGNLAERILLLELQVTRMKSICDGAKALLNS